MVAKPRPGLTPHNILSPLRKGTGCSNNAPGSSEIRGNDRLQRRTSPCATRSRSSISDRARTTTLLATSTSLLKQRTSSCRLCAACHRPEPDCQPAQRARGQARSQRPRSSGSSCFSLMRSGSESPHNRLYTDSQPISIEPSRSAPGRPRAPYVRLGTGGAISSRWMPLYLRNSSEADPASLFRRTDCLLPLTTTLIVPETPYSLLWKLPR